MTDIKDWEKSKQRRMQGGWVEPASLPAGPNGRALCRWCQLEILPGRRRTFCSDYCVHEFRLRSDPAYLRDKVFDRDKGVCAKCGIDARAVFFEMKRAKGAKRLRMLSDWGLKRMHRDTLWDADHITPVVEGGGECDLNNMRTLCLRCHREETSRLRARMVSAG